MTVRLPMSNGEEYLVRPQKIICLGLNYRKHITESAEMDGERCNHEIPPEPILFAKTPNVLIGPEEPIIIPNYLQEYGFRTCRTDYEGELALIIGKKGKNIKQENVYEHVLGYTCFNDVSQRNFQKHDTGGWFRAKSLDTYGPIGPVVVLRDEVKDPGNLAIRTRLNGEIVQDSNTSYMIFDIPETIAFISKHFTLEEGDIILTGTPDGIGPLVPGDVVEVEIEQIGTLKNHVQTD